MNSYMQKGDQNTVTALFMQDLHLIHLYIQLRNFDKCAELRFRLTSEVV